MDTERIVARTKALEEQERLFPRGIWREYKDTATPSSQWRSIPPTLANICFDLRSSLNGAADPCDPKDTDEVMAMLQARLDTWWDKGGTEDEIDKLVKALVEATLRWAKAWRASE